MSKDMKWVKRHRAMLDSWPESGGGPGGGGGRGGGHGRGVQLKWDTL
jgi:hypothetical protein